MEGQVVEVAEGLLGEAEAWAFIMKLKDFLTNVITREIRDPRQVPKRFLVFPTRRLFCQIE